MATSRDHLVHMPRNFIVLRVFQLVFALFVLGLSIFCTVYLVFGGMVLNLFTSLCTCIVTIYIISATTCAPRAYNYWAILALEIFLLIFWLVSFAVLAADTVLGAAYLGLETCNYYGYCVQNTATKAVRIYLLLMAVTSALGALLFVFFLISLVILSVMIHRHRKAGKHSNIAAPYTANGVYNPNVPYNANPPYNPNTTGTEKVQMQPQAYPVPNGGQHEYYVQPPPPVAGMPQQAPYQQQGPPAPPAGNLQQPRYY